MADESRKWSEMFLAFLKNCFMDLPPESQQQFWESVGNAPYARLHQYLNPLDKEVGFNGKI